MYPSASVVLRCPNGVISCILGIVESYTYPGFPVSIVAIINPRSSAVNALFNLKCVNLWAKLQVVKLVEWQDGYAFMKYIKLERLC